MLAADHRLAGGALVLHHLRAAAAEVEQLGRLGVGERRDDLPHRVGAHLEVRAHALRDDLQDEAGGVEAAQRADGTHVAVDDVGRV